MKTQDPFAGLLGMLEREEITGAEYYAALEQLKATKLQHASEREEAERLKPLKFRPSVIREKPLFVIIMGVFVYAIEVGNPGVWKYTIPVAMMIFAYLKYSFDMEIRDGLITIEDGLIAKNVTEFSLQDIRSFKMKQTAIQRFIGTADVEFYTAGDRPESVFKGLGDPDLLRRFLNAEKVGSRGRSNR